MWLTSWWPSIDAVGSNTSDVWSWNSKSFFASSTSTCVPARVRAHPNCKCLACVCIRCPHHAQNLISDEYFCTSLMRPWGRDGEDVECYGIDLDALYVNTGFRIAVLDIFRGPARLKLPSVTRFAGPEEFKPKKRTRGLLGFFGGGGGSSSDDDEGVSTAPELHTAYGDKKAEWNPQGNWLWQLATELVPVERDDTDVLNSEIPPPFNRHRNPKCHPHAGAGADADGDGSIPVPPSILDMVKGAVPSDDGGAAAVEAAAETTEINEKRLKVGLPPLPNPNSAAEQEKRLRARKTAVHLNTQVRFNVPRHELEQILREFEGPFGPVASPNEPVRPRACHARPRVNRPMRVLIAGPVP